MSRAWPWPRPSRCSAEPRARRRGTSSSGSSRRPPPPSAARPRARTRRASTRETSSAIQKRSRGVSVKRPSRSSAAAKATECTSRSSSPPNVSATWEKTRSMSASERTSHSVTSGLPTDSASSRTFFSIRSPWYVKASCAPPSASRRRDRPRDRAPVCDAQDEAALSLEGARHSGESTATLSGLAPHRHASRRHRGARNGTARLQPRCSPCGATPSIHARPRRDDLGSGRRIAADGSAWSCASRSRRWRRRARSYASAGSQRRLNVSSASSRTYLADLARSQAAARAALRQAIPEARVVPQLPGAAERAHGRAARHEAAGARRRLGFVTKVYPSIRYSVALNRSAAVMARPLSTPPPPAPAAPGSRSPSSTTASTPRTRSSRRPACSIRPASRRAPGGGRAPKVIVARTFPGPGSGRRGRLALDPRASASTAPT